MRQLQRALLVCGVTSTIAGTLLMHSAAAEQPQVAGHSQVVTVTGPHLWDPVHNKPFASASTVSVSQTGSLVNQMVHVAWAHFTPSNTVLYDPAATDYPVMVAECKGANPASLNDCYGANNGGVQGSFGPDGPMNTSYGTTAANGTGQLDVQVLTAAENQFLGCDRKHPCSLVVVPAQGGNIFVTPPDCSDHSVDVGGSAIGELAFSAGHGQCSWQDRIVIPLGFAPAPTACPLRNADFSIAGSPMMARAMSQWQAGLCGGAHGLTIDYNSTVPEPLAVSEASGGLADVALTTRPASADGVSTNGSTKFAYAPVAVSAVSIAYWIDNPVTGQPVTRLRLNQRLVDKLLTQSYNFQNEGVGCAAPPPPKGIGCDKWVRKANPITLFTDPEFSRLNPGVQPVVGYGAAFQVPTVQSGHSDMTWTVTRWIAANPNASAFQHGSPDPWGMTVNGSYRGLAYPTDAFTAQDPYPVIAHKYSPVFPLSLADSYQAENWDPGTSYLQDQTGNYPKDPIQIPGERALIAILDQASAAAFTFPVAAIPNAAGHYVQPTSAAMAAAVADMTPAGSGTAAVSLSDRNPAAYPLTMVIYAMVPVSGISHAKAGAIARFLRFAASAGQTSGVNPGQLPVGYLPLPRALRAQTVKIAGEVAAQSPGGGRHGGGHQGPPRTQGGGPSGHPTPGAARTPSAPNVPAVQSARLIADAHPVSAADWTRFTLPALLIMGGLAAIGGSAALLETANMRVLLRTASKRVRLRRKR